MFLSFVPVLGLPTRVFDCMRKNVVTKRERNCKATRVILNVLVELVTFKLEVVG
jgi:hypothetical protein